MKDAYYCSLLYSTLRTRTHYLCDFLLSFLEDVRLLSFLEPARLLGLGISFGEVVDGDSTVVWSGMDEKVGVTRCRRNNMMK